MRKTLTTAVMAIMLSIAFVGCKDPSQSAAAIIEANERARAQAKLEEEVARLRAEAENRTRQDALAKSEGELAKVRAELAKAQADSNAKEKSAVDAEAIARKIRADADANRNLAELRDAANKAEAAAKSAQAAAAMAANLNNQLRQDLAQAKADADARLNAINNLNSAAPGTTIIGSNGGKVRSPGNSGATINVPAGSVRTNTPMTINVVPPPPVVGGKSAVCAVACTPHGAVFNPPVQVIFPLGHSRFPPGSRLLLSFWNATTFKYDDPVPPIFAVVSRKNNAYAVALVPHFSDLVLTEPSNYEEPNLSWNNVPGYEMNDEDVPDPNGPGPMSPDIPDRPRDPDFQKPYDPNQPDTGIRIRPVPNDPDYQKPYDPNQQNPDIPNRPNPNDPTYQPPYDPNRPNPDIPNPNNPGFQNPSDTGLQNANGPRYERSGVPQRVPFEGNEGQSDIPAPAPRP